MTIKQSWLDHERVLLNPNAIPIRTALHPKGDRCWRRFCEFGRHLVVDNHIPWEKFASRWRNVDTAFILGTSVLNERPQLLRVFEDHAGRRKEFKNVFAFGVVDSATDGCGRILKLTLALDRLDFSFISLFDRNQLETVGDFGSPFGFKNPFDEEGTSQTRVLAHVRYELHRLLSARALDTSVPTLRERVKNRAHGCRYRYRECIEVAEMCLAQLLIDNRRARQSFARRGSTNAFLDAGIVKDGLFFDAEVLSEDYGVIQMARFAGLGVRKAP